MPKFKYDAEKVQELITAGYAIVLFQDGLGGVTALAAKGDPRWVEGVLQEAVDDWMNNDEQAEFAEYNTDKMSESDLDALQARTIFVGADKFSGAGVGPKAVSVALHSLTEKALRDRLPVHDKADTYHNKPPKPKKGRVRKSNKPKAAELPQSSGCGSE